MTSPFRVAPVGRYRSFARYATANSSIRPDVQRQPQSEHGCGRREFPTHPRPGRLGYRSPARKGGLIVSPPSLRWALATEAGGVVHPPWPPPWNPPGTGSGNRPPPRPSPVEEHTPGVLTTQLRSDPLSASRDDEADSMLPPRPPSALGDTPNPLWKRIAKSARPKRHGSASRERRVGVPPHPSPRSAYRAGGRAAAHGSKLVVAISGVASHGNRPAGGRGTAQIPPPILPVLSVPWSAESEFPHAAPPGLRRANLSGGRIVPRTALSRVGGAFQSAAPRCGARGRSRAACHRLARDAYPRRPNRNRTPPPLPRKPFQYRGKGGG